MSRRGAGGEAGEGPGVRRYPIAMPSALRSARYCSLTLKTMSSFSFSGGERSPGSCGSAAMIFFAISRSAQSKRPRACRRDVDRLHPALQVRLRAVLDELLDDEAERVALDRLHVLHELAGGGVHGLRHLRRDCEVRLDDLDGGEHDDLQLTERREEVLDVVLAAVIREVLTDDERELLRGVPREDALTRNARRRP